MRKLSPYAIRQLHDMHRQGVTKCEIAARLGVHRHTVRSHLDGMVTYPAELISRVGLRVRLCEDEPLSLHDASNWLPGQPSRSLMHEYLSRGMLETEIVRTGGKPRHMMTFDQLERFCAQYWPLPASLYVPLHEITCYSGGWMPNEDDILRNGLFPVCPLVVLVRECASKLGAGVLRRAARCLSRMGIGVL